MNFYEMNNTFSKFDLTKVKEIFNEIEENLKQNVGPVVKLINEDNTEFAEKFTYSKLIETIQKIKSEPWELEKKSKNLRINGLGNLAVIYNGSPELLLYLSLKALKTHNNIVFFEDTNIHKTSNYIINLINNIINKKDYKTTITVKQIKKIKEISEYEKYFNSVLCIGEIYKYENLKDSIKTNIIYNAYGTVSLYLDDKDLKNTLLDMDEYVFENNLMLDLYKDENVEDVINKINKKGENFCSIIFTKNTKKAYIFLENVNAQTIYINKNPFKEYRFFIDDKDLVKEKRIVI